MPRPDASDSPRAHRIQHLMWMSKIQRNQVSTLIRMGYMDTLQKELRVSLTIRGWLFDELAASNEARLDDVPAAAKSIPGVKKSVVKPKRIQPERKPRSDSISP